MWGRRPPWGTQVGPRVGQAEGPSVGLRVRDVGQWTFVGPGGPPSGARGPGVGQAEGLSVGLRVQDVGRGTPVCGGQRLPLRASGSKVWGRDRPWGWGGPQLGPGGGRGASVWGSLRALSVGLEVQDVGQGTPMRGRQGLPLWGRGRVCGAMDPHVGQPEGLTRGAPPGCCCGAGGPLMGPGDPGVGHPEGPAVGQGISMWGLGTPLWGRGPFCGAPVGPPM